MREGDWTLPEPLPGSREGTVTLPEPLPEREGKLSALGRALWNLSFGGL